MPDGFNLSDDFSQGVRRGIILPDPPDGLDEVEILPGFAYTERAPEYDPESYGYSLYDGSGSDEYAPYNAPESDEYAPCGSSGSDGYTLYGDPESDEYTLYGDYDAAEGNPLYIDDYTDDPAFAGDERYASLVPFDAEDFREDVPPPADEEHPSCIDDSRTSNFEKPASADLTNAPDFDDVILGNLPDVPFFDDAALEKLPDVQSQGSTIPERDSKPSDTVGTTAAETVDSSAVSKAVNKNSDAIISAETAADIIVAANAAADIPPAPEAVTGNVPTPDTAAGSVPAQNAENIPLPDTAAESVPTQNAENIPLPDTAAGNVPAQNSATEKVPAPDTVAKNVITADNFPDIIKARLDRLMAEIPVTKKPLRKLRCCFTGNRRVLAATPELSTTLNILIKWLLCNNVSIFMSGSALGFDTLAELALSFRDYPELESRLTLLLPNASQPKYWRRADTVTLDIMKSRSDRSVLCSEEDYEPDTMLFRDRILSDAADISLSFSMIGYLSSEKTSGTQYTMNHLHKIGKAPANLARVPERKALSKSFHRYTLKPDSETSSKELSRKEDA